MFWSIGALARSGSPGMDGEFAEGGGPAERSETLSTRRVAVAPSPRTAAEAGTTQAQNMIICAKKRVQEQYIFLRKPL